MGQVFQDFEGRFEEFVTAGTLDELGVVPLRVAPGASCVEHSHVGVEEVMIVKSGRGRFEIEDRWFDVCEGSVALVPSGEFHAVHNTGDEDLELVAIVNANVDFSTIEVKSRAQHFSARADDRSEERAELRKLRTEMASVGALLAEVRSELDAVRKASKPKRAGARAGRAA